MRDEWRGAHYWHKIRFLEAWCGGGRPPCWRPGGCAPTITKVRLLLLPQSAVTEQGRACFDPRHARPSAFWTGEIQCDRKDILTQRAQRAQRCCLPSDSAL